MPRRSPSRLPAGMLAAAALESLEERPSLLDRLLPPSHDSVRITLGTPISEAPDRTEPGAP